MKKIFILANSSEGLYDFRNELIQELLTSYEVFIAVPDDKATKKLATEGCKVIRTRMNRRGMNPVQDLELWLQYRVILQKVRPDVVLTYTIKPNIYGSSCAKDAGIPYISNITGLGTTFERGGLVKLFVTFLYRRSLKKAECIFYQNSHNKDVLEKSKIFGKKARLVNGSGVNLEKHVEEPYPENPIPKFLFVGRIMKEKGIEEYLEAAEQFAGRAEFGIIGYCEERYEKKIQQLSERGIINFHGFQTEVHSFLKESDAVIVPSYHEGMSNVILEAAATARPVLATSISGCMEGFEEEITGFGFSPKSAEELKAAVEKFLALSAEERMQMGKAARRKMEREFDRKQVVAAYMEEIEACTARREGL